MGIGNEDDRNIPLDQRYGLGIRYYAALLTDVINSGIFPEGVGAIWDTVNTVLIEIYNRQDALVLHKDYDKIDGVLVRVYGDGSKLDGLEMRPVSSSLGDILGSSKLTDFIDFSVENIGSVLDIRLGLGYSHFAGIYSDGLIDDDELIKWANRKLMPREIAPPDGTFKVRLVHESEEYSEKQLFLDIEGYEHTVYLYNLSDEGLGFWAFRAPN